MKKHYLLHPYGKLSIGIACLIPFFYLYTYFKGPFDQIEGMEKSFNVLARKEKEGSFHQYQKENFFLEIEKADHFYLDKHIETLDFLTPEGIQVRSFQKNGQAHNNRLLFIEEKISRNDFLLEVEERQQHPVAMHAEDLKNLLCQIEGVQINNYKPQIGRPHLIIKNFNLKRSPSSPEEDIFIINMKLIKKEKNPS